MRHERSDRRIVTFGQDDLGIDGSVRMRWDRRNMTADLIFITKRLPDDPERPFLAQRFLERLAAPGQVPPYLAALSQRQRKWHGSFCD